MKPICLTIAGSDSSGGAGVQADLKTFASLGCYGATVVTALTAQNTLGVHAVSNVQADLVHSQLDAVMTDMPVAAIKIGMLADRSIIGLVADYLANTELPIVLDPVAISSSGTTLLNPDDIPFLVDLLFPLCRLITPNLKEAELLSGLSVRSPADLKSAACRLLKSGVDASLITGGDRSGNSKSDFLSYRNPSGQVETTRFTHASIQTQNSHGTGCTLSSAITAQLAQGIDLTKAVESGIDYTHTLLRQSVTFQTGKGVGGLDHFATLSDTGSS